MDGKPYADFDADGLTVHVPDGKKRHKIRVRVVPTIDPFEVHHQVRGRRRRDDPDGQARHEHLRASSRPRSRASSPRSRARLVLKLQDLESIANVGIRVLLFARQRMEISDRADIYAVAPKAAVSEALAARRSGPGRHQRRRELRPVPGSRRPRQASLEDLASIRRPVPRSGRPPAPWRRLLAPSDPGSGCGRIRLVDVALADLDDVAVGIGDPG